MKNSVSDMELQSPSNINNAGTNDVHTNDVHTNSVPSDRRKLNPSGKQESDMTTREKVAHFLHHNHKFHIFIIVLVFVDTALVIIELSLEASKKAPKCSIQAGLNGSSTLHIEEDDMNHTLETAEHVLHYCSVTILGVFFVEIFVKIYAFGCEFFHHKLEIFDAVVVSVSLFLDIFLSKRVLKTTVSLLVLMRLWRITRIINGIVLAVESTAKENKQELRDQLSAAETLNEQLKQKLQTSQEVVEVLQTSRETSL